MSRCCVHNAGFAILEIIVYLAIFVVVTTASVGFLLSLDDFIDQYRLETMLYRSGTNVMEQVLVALRQADSVDLINTIEDTPNAGKLVVENVATTTEFAFTGGALNLVINGDEYGDLTNDNVVVDAFTVYHYPYGDNEFVRVRLDITATLSSGEAKSTTLFGSAVVRGAI